jgi:hypothetical protein
MPLILTPTSPAVTTGTIQEVLDEARVILQDADKVRYTDAELLVLLNYALSEAKGLRPDLFFGSYGSAWVDKQLADAFPLEPRYRPVIGDYVVARAELREADHVESGRAAALYTVFKQGLLAL